MMSKFSAIESRLLNDQVYVQIKDAIFNKVLPPGTKLDIYQIADQFNVSRTPVKEAFNRLNHEGLINIRPRKGTFVVELNNEDIVELLDARLMFEQWAGQAAIHHCVEEDVQHLESIASLMERCYMSKPFNYLEFMELDIQFHEYIIQMGKNQRITEMYKRLNVHRMIALGYYEIAYEIIISDSHREIVNVFRERNAQKFLELITKHIMDTERGLLHSSKNARSGE